VSGWIWRGSALERSERLAESKNPDGHTVNAVVPAGRSLAANVTALGGRLSAILKLAVLANIQPFFGHGLGNGKGAHPDRM